MMAGLLGTALSQAVKPLAGSNLNVNDELSVVSCPRNQDHQARSAHLPAGFLLCVTTSPSDF
jgi:hypothetical protein